MKHTIKRLLALALSTAMVCSLMSLPALAAGAKTDGIWNYTVSEDGTAAIVGAKDDYKSQSVVLIPAQLAVRRSARWAAGPVPCSPTTGAAGTS